jgi:hypothetical protein
MVSPQVADSGSSRRAVKADQAVIDAYLGVAH